MRIIAYKTFLRDNKVLLEESGGQFVLSNDPSELFAFLLEPYENSIRVCWELDTTVAPLLRLLGTKVCKSLQSSHKGYLPPFSIFYVPNKVFSITHLPTKVRCQLYELQQYFPELPEPANTDELVMLGQKLIYELKKMSLEPTKLTSPIAIYEECVMSKMNLPKLKDMPKEAAEMTYRCSGRLWIESHILGYWEKAYDYDMASAFPSVAKELIDTRDCEWAQSKKFMKSAIYGYVKCKVAIDNWVMVSPIIMEIEDGLVSPTGTWETYLTKGELEFITKHNIGCYEIIDGWWAIPRVKKNKLSKPLYTPMTKLLSFKQRTGLQTLLAKRMSNGLYGKLGEDRTEEFGPHFFPCWFAEISTQTRLRVAEFLYAYGIGPGVGKGYDTLIHIGVDGALLSEPVENSGNGKWKLVSGSDVLVVSSGLVYTRVTKPKGLRLTDILEMIAEHPRKGYYAKGVVRRLTLGDSLAQSRLQDIGKEMEFQSSINLIKQEHDRKFKKVPKTGEALLKNKYVSVPMKTAG